MAQNDIILLVISLVGLALIAGGLLFMLRSQEPATEKKTAAKVSGRQT